MSATIHLVINLGPQAFDETLRADYDAIHSRLTNDWYSHQQTSHAQLIQRMEYAQDKGAPTALEVIVM